MNDINSQDEMLISEVISQAQYCGVRRMLVISGQQDWCYQQARALAINQLGHCHWITEQQQLATHSLAAAKVTALLGQELQHTIFDGTEGIDADALAAISGNLSAGSLLVLLVPDWQSWVTQPDKDSLRWSEQGHAISTPRFISHLQNCLLADPATLIWRQGSAIQGGLLACCTQWQKPKGQPTVQQNALLQQLLTAQPDYYVLTANRGRGKSSLAGMLVAHWQGEGECWLTGPNKASVAGVLHWSDNQAKFIAPDALIELCQSQKIAHVDWLIIDEAAAIPTPLLAQLTEFFPRILFTTTVLGYEGTGRGFLLKFCDGLPHWQHLVLSEPIRWADNDPLEALINHILLFDAEGVLSPTLGNIKAVWPLSQQQLGDNLALLRQFYGLLTSAHYRTSPLDLRRLLDAPKQICQAAISTDEQIIGALWAVNEGGLNASLAHEVWAGRRRPKGNLVAQSLSAHGGLYQAPLLRSVRVSRIAVQAQYRRQGIARQLILDLAHQGKIDHIDYLSVSFGYTEPLYQFWSCCGFKLIHIGSQKEASSGCYAAMAILPLTPAGQVLCDEGLTQLQRNSVLSWHNGLFPIKPSFVAEQSLAQADWYELAGFAFAYRTIESAFAALQRLWFVNPDQTATALQAYLQHPQDLSSLASQLTLSGKKALMSRLRQDAAQLLFAVDPEKTVQLQEWVAVTE